MSTREALINEIEKQPEPILIEIQHYLKFLLAQRESNTKTKRKGWPQGYFERTAGAFANQPIERMPQPLIERREEW